jgi:hypothetical protein
LTSVYHDDIKLRSGNGTTGFWGACDDGDLMERIGVHAAEVVAEELPYNRWLSLAEPWVWRVRPRGMCTGPTMIMIRGDAQWPQGGTFVQDTRWRVSDAGSHVWHAFKQPSS